MIVKELIEKLLDMDQDALVCIPGVDSEGCIVDNYPTSVQQVSCGWDDSNGWPVYEVFIE